MHLVNISNSNALFSQGIVYVLCRIFFAWGLGVPVGVGLGGSKYERL